MSAAKKKNGKVGRKKFGGKSINTKKVHYKSFKHELICPVIYILALSFFSKPKKQLRKL